MNQAVADFFLSLPAPMTDPVWVGTACLLLCWLGYFAAIRGPLLRAVRKRCSPRILQSTVPRPHQRLFYRALRRKAGLDDGFLYIGNVAVFTLLSVSGIAHVLLAVLIQTGLASSSVIADMDIALISVTVSVCGVLSLGTQPRSTWERRERLGFYRQGTLVHIVLRELFILFVMAFWYYDAFFLPAIVAIS